MAIGNAPAVASTFDMSAPGAGTSDDLETARALLRAGRAGDAERIARGLVEADPGNGPAWNLLGAAAHAVGDLHGAARWFEKSLLANPDDADARSNMAMTLRALDRAIEAADHFAAAQALRPDDSELRLAYGAVLRDLGKHDAAIEQYRAVLGREPGRIEAQGGMALALMKAERFDEAAGHIDRVLRVAPDHPASVGILGDIRRRQRRFDEAIALYRRVLSLESDAVEANVNLGLTLRDLAMPEAALPHLRHAFDVAPGDANAATAYGHTLLLLGELGPGWDASEARFRGSLRHAPVERYVPQSRWRGESLAGKSIVLWAEQGIGDEIMFASLVPEMASAAARVVLETESRLVPLFARSLPGVEVVARSIPPDPATQDPSIDFQSPLASLPRRLRRQMSDFTTTGAYLAADPAKVAALRSRYLEGAGGGRRLVGVSWHTTNAKLGPRRTIGLEAWGPILGVPGVTFISLQYGDWRDAIAAAARATGADFRHDPAIDPLTDMDGFAAQVAAMDLTISIDNSTVHVAGALGRPAWALLPAAPEWRWFLRTGTSPWYASLSLLRQETLDDWRPVIATAAARLARWVQEKT